MDQVILGVKSGGRSFADWMRLCARGWVWAIAFILLVILPWIFGGSTPFAGKLVYWAGISCLVPLTCWFVADRLDELPFDHAIWLPLICWGLLSVQIAFSLQNPSAQLSPPWNGSHFTQLEHDSSWPSSGFPQHTRGLGRLYLAYGLLFLTCLTVGAFGKSFLYLTLCFLLNGLVMGLVGLPFKFSGELSILGFWPASEWYFYSAFVYHNHWGAYALLCLAAASAVGFGTCLDRPRCLLAVIFAGGLLLGTTLVATARLATLMQVMFVFSVLVSLARLHPSLLSRRLLPLIFLCGALVVGGAVILMKQGGAASGGHRTWAKLLSQNPFTSRLHLVEDTLPMIAAKPLFGWGLGAYRSGFRLYQRPETRVVHNQGRITLYNHAHNDWIQTLAELGVVGCFLLLTPFGYYLFRARFGMNLPEFQRWLVFGCLVLLLMAWGESLFLNRSVAAAFFILLGLALHPTTRKPRDCIDKGNPEG